MPVGAVTASKPRVSVSSQQSTPQLPAGIDSGMLSKLGISTSSLRTPDQDGITGTQTTSNYHQADSNNPNDTNNQTSFFGPQRDSRYDFIFGFLHWLLHLMNPGWQGSSHNSFHRLFDPSWQRPRPCPWQPWFGDQSGAQQQSDPWSQWNEQGPTSNASTQGSTASMTNQGSTVAKATTQGLQVNPQSLKSK